MQLPTFSTVEQEQLSDFLSELPRIIEEDLRYRVLNLVTSQKELYLSPIAWRGYRLPNIEILSTTWIGPAMAEIREGGGMAWVTMKLEEERFDHPSKTNQRLETVRDICGISRILLTSLAKVPWIHPELKYYWYVTSDSENDSEYPHEAECTVDGRTVSVLCD